MKNKATRALRLLLLSAAVILLTGSIIAWAKPLVAHTQTGKQKLHPAPTANAKGFGYGKDIRDGYLYCGQEFIVFVSDPSFEITTGTPVWSNPRMTAPYPNGIITSLSGSTYGQSFFITNGIVGGPAIPC